ncbi:MAG: hypothetical protein J7M40_12250 [Planctomycetes bacterium]|nr:hypothetical protein [Planctomycetota bacterium]
MAIVDISLNGTSGLELTERINLRWPDLLVLIFSSHNKAAYVRRAFRRDARGIDMTRRDMKGKTMRFHRPTSQRNCPECGGKMMEVDRCHENGMLFVWHECNREDCNGQWLQKIPQKSQNRIGTGSYSR